MHQDKLGYIALLVNEGVPDATVGTSPYATVGTSPDALVEISPGVSVGTHHQDLCIDALVLK